MTESDSPDSIMGETHAGPCPWCDAMVVDGQCSREGCEFEILTN